MGILKSYPDGLVLPTGRYRQFETKVMLIPDLLKKKLKGYVKDGIYWIIYLEENKYYKVPFARNTLWFKALASEPEFVSIGKLPQIYLI